MKSLREIALRQRRVQRAAKEKDKPVVSCETTGKKKPETKA